MIFFFHLIFPCANIFFVLRRPHKTYIKFIAEHLNWGPQILHINNKVSRNMGIIYKLKYFLDIHTLTQLYYTLIYPYLSYGI